ncbi:MAG: nitroreductase family protein [Fretibacterium sp.]|nr:nitroreductase family protein [Fretibacterium sp.]
MNILPEIANRRSVRKYTDKDITDEQVALLIEAARLAPSGSNKQPWDFLVVRSVEMRKKISEIDNNQTWMMTAPVFIVCIGNERYRGDGKMECVIRDSAIATEHILLQAEHMGLAACWTGWYDQNKMRQVLELDELCYVVGVVTIGYAEEKPTGTPRRVIKYRTL